MPKDTIAFVSTYTHPSRDSVETMIRAAFPEYGIENISVPDIVKGNKHWRIPNLWFVAAEYGRQILTRRTSIREGYFRTTYLFRRIREAMRERIDPARHVFSFQTQSIYDTSVPGVPHFLYTDHSHLSNLHSPYFDRRTLRPQAWLALEREIYQNAARVFTRSSDVTTDIVQQYGIHPAKVVRVCCGTNASIPRDHHPDNKGYSNRHILFVGGDWERKGGPELAAAFRQVLAVFPDAHLTIAGATPSLDLPNCSVLGNVSLNDLTKHYAEASVFCLPTRLEPFGIVFIEAMMHRLPVVSTLGGALPDMVEEGETGHLVPPGDAKRLAEVLIALLGDPDRCRRYGDAGYRKAMADYTWDRVGERIRTQVLPFVTSSTTPGIQRR